MMARSVGISLYVRSEASCSLGSAWAVRARWLTSCRRALEFAPAMPRLVGQPSSLHLVDGGRAPLLLGCSELRAFEYGYAADLRIRPRLRAIIEHETALGSGRIDGVSCLLRLFAEP